MRTTQIRTGDNSGSLPTVAVEWSGLSADQLRDRFYAGKQLYATFTDCLYAGFGTPLPRAPVEMPQLPFSLIVGAVFCRTWYVENPTGGVDMLIERPDVP